MSFNQSLILLITAICFGYIAITFVELLVAIAFWVSVGVAISAAVDVAAGLGTRACAARTGIRRWWSRGASFSFSSGRKHGLTVV